MSWFRRPPLPPPVEPYTGRSAGDLEAWLGARVTFFDGHADRGGARHDHILTITPLVPPPWSGDDPPFVQAAGGAQSATYLQSSGDRRFGGELTLPPGAEDRLLAAGWLEPDAEAEWRFHVAAVGAREVEPVVRLLMVAVREVLGVSDGRVTVEDSPYDAAR